MITFTHFASVRMKTKILVLIWFSSKVVLSDRDLLQQPGISPQITSSSHYSNWSADRILSNYSQSNADLCQCCAAIITPGHIDIDLRQTYSVSRVVVLGRLDQTTGSQFDNVVLAIHNGESITWSSKNNTVLSVDLYPYNLIQIIRLSSTLQSDGVMTICNVKVYGPEYLTGFPTQSSVYNTDCTADKALNGVEYPGINDTQLCQACSVTDGLNPWWSLDLGGEHLIGSIQVERRANNLQSNGLQVSITNALVGSNVVIPGNISVLGLDQQLNPPRLARYINITTISRTQEYMTLCEVKLFETDCANGTYGDKCAGNCKHCKGGFAQCDNIYGTCNMGCETGYVGLLCLHSCNTSSYGENCTERCGNCLNSSRCDLKNGSCPMGCSPGYRGVYCKQSCNTSSYGENCTKRCWNCLNGSRCDLKNGRCPGGCSPGYHGVYCNQTCTAGKYGLGCQNSCSENCRNNDTCNFINGVCSNGCVAGFDFSTDNTCRQVCNTNYYGENCAKRCDNCLNGTRCDMKNGSCPGGCSPGYFGMYCNQTCTTGEYGLGCQNSCSENCRNNETCNFINGVCANGCVAGFDFSTDDTCRLACADGYYGQGCSIHCGYCSSGAICDKVSGDCPSGGCEPGYNGLKCDQACATGKYGLRCQNSCSENCRNNETCNFINGVCANGCVAGFDFSTDDTCRLACADGNYGEGCSTHCGNCSSGALCDKVSGNCPSGGCKPGYKGLKCDQVCTNKTFEYNCEGHCRCKNTSEQCNVATGHCSSGCANGLAGVNCSKDCENGWFGENCNMTCGFCKNGAVCDKVSGNCTNGCDKGHTGQRCKSGCDKQAFGYDCENECHSYECDDEDGSCGLYACYRGWDGETCSQPIHTDVKQFERQKTGGGNIAIAVLTTLLVVSIIGNTIAVIKNCRRKARKSLAKDKKTDQNDYAVPGQSVPSAYTTLDVSEMNYIPTERHDHNVNDGQ